MNKSDLLRHWRFRIHRVQHAHYESGRIYERRHYFIGIPSIVMSTIVGTAVFASLAEFSESANLIYFTIGVGLLSLSSAVLVALQTFLNYKELAERHNLSGARFADLKHKLEIIATFPSTNDTELQCKLKELESEWVTIREDSPNFPIGLWKKIESKFTLEKDIETHPDFAKDV